MPKAPRLFANDRNLIVPKVLYLLQNLAVYAGYTYTAQYFSERWGIPIYKFGYLSILSATSFLGSLLWTMVADRTGHHRGFLVLGALGYMVLFSALPVLERLLSPEQKVSALGTAMIAVAFGGSSFFVSAVYPLLDNRVLVMLESGGVSTSQRKDLYGRQRLWGTVGQSVVTVVNGYGIGRFGYEFMFASVLLTSLSFAVVSFAALPPKRVVSVTEHLDADKNALTVDCPEVDSCDKHGEGAACSSGKANDQLNEKAIDCPKPLLSLTSSSTASDSSPPSSALQTFVKLFKSVDYSIFLIASLTAGFSRAILGNFLPVFLQSDLQLSPFLIGISLQARVITELALFGLSKQLLGWCGGPFGLMLLAQVSGTLRASAYAVIPTFTKGILWLNVALLVVPAELVKGINNAALVTAGVRLAHDLSPPGCATTGQGVFSGVYSNLANALAGFIGGLILQAYLDNPVALRILFGITGIVSFIPTIIWVVRYYIFTDNRRIQA